MRGRLEKERARKRSPERVRECTGGERERVHGERVYRKTQGWEKRETQG